MKARLKRLLILLAIFVPTVILLVEWNRFMKMQAPECRTGECRQPEGYGLVIDPFPDEIVPQSAQTNLTTGELNDE